MKKKIIIILAILCIATLVSVTTAYIVREANTNSIITFGSLKMKLIETTIEDGKEIPVNDKDSMNIYHSSNVSRIVKIENICKHPMYVRIALNIKGINKNKEQFNPTNLVEFNITDSWIYKDGYYYYKDVLKPGETTEELMNEIIFDNSKIIEEYKGANFKLNIQAQAVQSEHNENSVLDAKGWPE